MNAAQRPILLGSVGRAILCALATLLTGAVLAHAAGNARHSGERLEHAFMWNEASALAASATTEQDFMRVAERYRALSRAGASNGILYYNLGTALLNAGHYHDALNALARAERHMGSTVEIRRNMRLAIAGDREAADVFLPWYRLFLFWHYWPGFWLRLTLTGAALMIVWLWLMFAAFDVTPKPLRWLRGIALTVLVLYSSSVGTSLLQERRDRTQDRLMQKDEAMMSLAVMASGRGSGHG